MRQRGKSPRGNEQTTTDTSTATATPQLSIFLTDFGWFGLLGEARKIQALTIGHATSDAVRTAIARRVPSGVSLDSIHEQDWFPELRRELEGYASGRRADFSGFDIQFGRRTEFQKQVVVAARKIPYGRTATYGELAERAGFPRAARAVGSVMASNRVPIVIPCHRVVAAAGRLGGFSAPQGVELKQQMLTMEAVGG